MNILILLSKALGFTAKLPRNVQRALHVIALLAIAVVVVLCFASPLGLHLGGAVKLDILSAAGTLSGALGLGNAGDPLITAAEDAATEVIRAEKNALRAGDTLTPAEALSDAASVIPGAPPVVDELEQAAKAIVSPAAAVSGAPTTYTSGAGATVNPVA